MTVIDRDFTSKLSILRYLKFIFQPKTFFFTTMFLINSFTVSKLNNAEALSFFTNVQKTINSCDPELIGMSEEAITAYNKYLLGLIDQVYVTQSNLYITKMQEAEAKRDLIYRKIRMKLQTVEVAEEGSSLLPFAHKVKTLLLDKYSARVTQMPNQEESAILKGFVFDLRDKLSDDEAEELAISNDIVALENANNAFIDAYNQSLVNRSEVESEYTKKLRNALTDIYVSTCVDAQYYANSSDPGLKDKAGACQQFILVVNEIMADAKRRYRQRIKHNGGTVDEEEDDNTTDNETNGTGSSSDGSGTSGNGTGTSGNGSGNTGNGTGTGNTDNGGSIGGIPIIPGDGILD